MTARPTLTAPRHPVTSGKDVASVALTTLLSVSALILHQHLDQAPEDGSYLSVRLSDAGERHITLEGRGASARCWEQLWERSRQQALDITVNDPDHRIRRLDLSQYRETQRYLNVVSNEPPQKCKKTTFSLVNTFRNQETAHITQRP